MISSGGKDTPLFGNFSLHSCDEVLAFWFETLTPQQWWSKNDELDRLISQRFGDLHRRVTKCELFHWRKTAQGRLAEIIVLDQFSRNLFRNQAKAFAQDGQALVLAQEAVASGAQERLTKAQKSVLYLPYMHSESIEIHKLAVELYSESGLEEQLNFELRHKAIIDQFGRYPHRNEVLGRLSTPEEIEFLKQPGTSF
jgi:uncharacterized protein (DUF924 family)